MTGLIWDNTHVEQMFFMVCNDCGDGFGTQQSGRQ
jgi:hypothetical protein